MGPDQAALEALLAEFEPAEVNDRAPS
jgi:hypothetical protein